MTGYTKDTSTRDAAARAQGMSHLSEDPYRRIDPEFVAAVRALVAQLPTYEENIKVYHAKDELRLVRKLLENFT